jgi:hypothetical protein
MKIFDQALTEATDFSQYHISNFIIVTAQLITRKCGVFLRRKRLTEQIGTAFHKTIPFLYISTFCTPDLNWRFKNKIRLP